MNRKPGEIWFENGIGYTLTTGGRVIAVKTQGGVHRVAIAQLGPDRKPQGECFEGTPGAALRWLLEQEEEPKP